MGGLGEVGVTPRPPCSQPLQGEALAEAEAQVADGENLREERRHFGVQPRPGGRGASFPLGSLAELRSPLNADMAGEPPRSPHPPPRPPTL